MSEKTYDQLTASEKAAIDSKLKHQERAKLSVWRTVWYILAALALPFLFLVIIPGVVKLLIMPDAGYWQLVKFCFGWLGGLGLAGLILYSGIKTFIHR